MPRNIRDGVAPLGYLFIGFGAVLAVVGVLMFAKMGTQCISSVKMLGFEVQLAGSALVIVVVEVMLTMVPVHFGDRLSASESTTRSPH